MRIWTIAFSAASLLVYGWLAATFGLRIAVVTSLLLLPPAAYALRMCLPGYVISRRECVNLGLLTVAAISAMTFLVGRMFDAGLHHQELERRVVERDVDRLRQWMALRPGYKGVRVSYSKEKKEGFVVLLSGSVFSKHMHDQLLLERQSIMPRTLYHDAVIH
jgi:hypothetical protein